MVFFCMVKLDSNLLMASATLSLVNYSASKHDNDALVVLSSYASPHEDARITCDSIPDLLSNYVSEPSKVNEIRRLLMMQHPDCFQNHFVLFAETFNSRLTKKHVMLHIPKAGGTSVCQSVQQGGNLTSTGHNCWKKDFCPFWVGSPKCDNPKPTTCLELEGWSEDFVMNENWLDEICHDHTYSIVLRDPVPRTMSHVNNFLRSVANRKDHLADSKNWRLSLIQSNYMTWALSAASEIGKQDPKHFRPMEEHLQIAKSRLLQMDHIVDLSHQDKQCTKQMFEFMRIKKKIGHSNSAKSANYTADFSTTSVTASNTLDIQLYDFATRLLAVDCIFIGLVSEMNEKAT
jgi:hypothetical protein